MKRGFWIVFGALTQVLFLVTVYQVFAFFYAGDGDLLGIEPLPGALSVSGEAAEGARVTQGVLVDLLLLLQFALGHSLFLYPAVRSSIERLLPEGLYGSLYTVLAAGSLLATFTFWQPLPGIVFQTQGILSWLIQALFLASWGALLYSLSLTGFGFQTGFTTWWAYVLKREMPRRPLVTHGPYRYLRHPIYLSFLGLLWFTPRMTTDRLLLAGVWSLYIYVGSRLKDRRLLFFVGDRYCIYMREVPGYPFIPWGSLARGYKP